MRLTRPLVLSLLLVAALRGSASADPMPWSFGDTLTVIMKPIPNIPTILRPGDPLTVWANASPAASGWTAALNLASLSYTLTPAGGSYDATKGWWVLTFTVPPGLPEELYDLALNCSTCTPDVAIHAVKVIPQFRGDFYFAQISDTHLPEHTFSSGGSINTADTTGMGDFEAVIEDLNIIHPEFILHTGDLVNEGELEEYLGMYEMGRAEKMLARLRDPVFIVTGNHDVGGWDPTAPPPGTSRKAWWRQYGWKALDNPPAGYPYHTQNYSFDYGQLHCIGLEAYQNDGSYDDFETNIYGAQSMTQEQMDWLADDVYQAGSQTKLAFFHYDFGGTLPNGLAAPNFSQFNNPAALGLDAVIWGHNHGVAEGNLNAHPLNLGCQSVIDRRTFRIFRVHNGAITPSFMHKSGGISGAPDSLTATWSGPNNATRSGLSVTLNNRFPEAWEHAKCVFYLVNHDSSYVSTGGTIAQVVRTGSEAIVYVDCAVPASGLLTVQVLPLGPVGVDDSRRLSLAFPEPNPFRPEEGAMTLRYGLPVAGRVRIGVYDLSGRLVATLANQREEVGSHVARWDGRADRGEKVAAGLYLLRLESPTGRRQAKIVVVR